MTFLTFMSFLTWHFNATYLSMPHNGGRFHNPLLVTAGWPLRLPHAPCAYVLC